jgi:16S rRNA (adenine1518-N6/adenine1519-N6)-dimethyltransferase
VTLTRREARALLDQHGVAPSRALGQNFVVDPNTVRRIARLAGVGPGDPVVEVGAGLGSLTLALAETGARVTAIELDRHLLPVLRAVVAEARGSSETSGTVTVVEADAMALDWPSLLGDHERWSLVANLPYNVATPLILDLLVDVPAIDRMLVMVQREAGERLVAPAGSRTYGIPSVKVAHAARARIVGHVPASVFFPRPRVDSVLVELVRHRRPPVTGDRAHLFSLVEQGFGQRRKMLRRSLAGVVDDTGFARAGVDPTSRPEDLDLEAWARLSQQT